MTNIMATIIIVVQTNWASMGTFTDTAGNVFDVQRGRLVTNTIAVIEFENRKYDCTLKFELGPVVAEKKTPQDPYARAFDGHPTK